MVKFNANIEFVDTSGEIRSRSGDLTLRPDDSGQRSVIIGSGISLRPERDGVTSLGLTDIRWAAIWGRRLVATSGIISFLSCSSIDTVEINTSSLNFTGDDASKISHAGSLLWNGLGNDVNLQDVTSWDFGGAEVSAGNGFFTNLGANSLALSNRPLVNNSGIALQTEDYFDIFGGRNFISGNPISHLLLFVDDAKVGPHDAYFMVTQDVQIRRFGIQVAHVNGSQPPPWTIRLRINGRNNDHASGQFVWHPAANVPYGTTGNMSGTLTIPRGSICRFIVDSNGQPGHNTAYARVTLGVSVVSGLK